jgi:hypothetical protein
VAAGFVSTPAVVVFGIVAAIGTGINTFLVRGNEAMDAGEEDWVGRAVTAGVSDMVPVVDPVGWAEVVTGYNYMTGQEMTGHERGQRAGDLTAGAVGDVGGFGAVLGTTKSVGKKKFLRDTAGEFKDKFGSLEKSNPDSPKWEVSTRAHELTQDAMKEKYGDAIVDEPSMGVSHAGRTEGKPRYNKGAKSDLWNLDVKANVELKSEVVLSADGELLVPKPVNGKWILTRTDQLESLEIFAKSHPDWSGHVIDSKGHIYTYDAKFGAWFEEKFKK